MHPRTITHTSTGQTAHGKGVHAYDVHHMHIRIRIHTGNTRHTHDTLRNGKHINDTWCANMATAAQCVVWAHGEETGGDPGTGAPAVPTGAQLRMSQVHKFRRVDSTWQ